MSLHEEVSWKEMRIMRNWNDHHKAAAIAENEARNCRQYTGAGYSRLWIDAAGSP
jgi:hypothetical protein